MKTGTTKARSITALYKELNYKNELGSDSLDLNGKKAAIKKCYFLRKWDNWYFASRINSKTSIIKQDTKYIMKDHYIIVTDKDVRKKYYVTNFEELVLYHICDFDSRYKLTKKIFEHLKFMQDWETLEETYEGNEFCLEYVEGAIDRIVFSKIRSAIKKLKNDRIIKYKEYYVDDCNNEYDAEELDSAKEKALSEMNIEEYELYSKYRRKNNHKITEFNAKRDEYFSQERGKEIKIVSKKMLATSAYVKLQNVNYEREIMTLYIETIRESIKQKIHDLPTKQNRHVLGEKSETYMSVQQKQECFDLLDEYCVYEDGDVIYKNVSDLPNFKEILKNTITAEDILDFSGKFIMTKVA
ncbi:MAG: hypothetical protein IJE46_06390 [Clostridia bacterium]|nr:hypothetical protein [Clostridia bacterium]